jgi:GPH family glycoside/pentoside/hexuronide:cation symporter
MIVSNLAFSLASVSIYMQWGLVGEAIDYNEMISGKRTEGSIYGTFNLSRRVGKAIAQSAGMFIITCFGYNVDIKVQTESAILGIKIITMLLPGIIILGSWAAFKFVWNMSSETRAKISAFKESRIKIEN